MDANSEWKAHGRASRSNRSHRQHHLRVLVARSCFIECFLELLEWSLLNEGAELLLADEILRHTEKRSMQRTMSADTSSTTFGRARQRL
jgi:hypothetical protein